MPILSADLGNKSVDMLIILLETQLMWKRGHCIYINTENLTEITALNVFLKSSRILDNSQWQQHFCCF